MKFTTYREVLDFIDVIRFFAFWQTWDTCTRFVFRMRWNITIYVFGYGGDFVVLTSCVTSTIASGFRVLIFGPNDGERNTLGLGKLK